MSNLMFRAKSIHDNKWCIGYYYNNCDIGLNEDVLVCPNYEKGTADYKRIDRGTLGQYTGINDMWAKNIYEDDIVRCGYGTGKVIEKNGCFMVEWIKDRHSDMEFLFSRNGRGMRTGDDVFEVIGNIIDNPEMLQQ